MAPTRLILAIILHACAAAQSADDSIIRGESREAGIVADDTEHMKYGDQRAKDAWIKWPAAVRREFAQHFKGATILNLKNGEHRNFVQKLTGFALFVPHYYKATLMDQADRFDAEVWTIYRQHPRSDEPQPYVFLAVEEKHRTPLLQVPRHVLDAAKALGTNIEWNDPAEIEKEKEEQKLFKFKGRLNGETVKADIFEDGSVKKADKRLSPPLGNRHTSAKESSN